VFAPGKTSIHLKPAKLAFGGEVERAKEEEGLTGQECWAAGAKKVKDGVPTRQLEMADA